MTCFIKLYGCVSAYQSVVLHTIQLLFCEERFIRDVDGQAAVRLLKQHLSVMVSHQIVLAPSLNSFRYFRCQNLAEVTQITGFTLNLQKCEKCHMKMEVSAQCEDHEYSKGFLSETATSRERCFNSLTHQLQPVQHKTCLQFTCNINIWNMHINRIRQPIWAE